MKDNRGFSLIELIAAMAIAAVLAGIIYANINLLEFAHTRGCAETLDLSLSRLRIETMSRWNKNHYMILEWRSSEDRYYMNLVTSTLPLTEENWATDADIIQSRAIAGRNIKVSVSEYSDGSHAIAIDSANPCVILKFVPESGAFLSNWKQIIISSRGDRTIIHMMTKTGKHYIT